MDRELEQRIATVKAQAEGSWTPILERIGVKAEILNRKNQPCPGCGGDDRFQYTDKFRHGDYYCRGCGAGDGFKLAEMVLGCDFMCVLKDVEEALGGPLPVSKQAPVGIVRMRALAEKIWKEAVPVTPGDEVDRYLSGRGLHMEKYPSVLRFHPALGYYEKQDGGKSEKVAEYPAMLACVQGQDGLAVTLHRTYLRDGKKANLPDVKKLLSSGINGAAVRLFPAAAELAVAEGIEKSLALHLATGRPVWPALNCGNLEKLWIPESVRSLKIYGDNDSDSQFDGEAAAYALARRVRKEELRRGYAIDVEVFIPKNKGEDWEDVWRRRLARKLKAA